MAAFVRLLGPPPLAGAAPSAISTRWANWQNALASAGNQSGIDTWRVAIVLGYGLRQIDRDRTFDDGKHAQIPFAEIQWARKQLPGASVGAEPTSPEQVVKAGDVIYVEPVDTTGNYGLRQVPEVNGAIVAMDPHTGRVAGAVRRVQLCVQPVRSRQCRPKRQPGSSFKPFVYAAALDNGYTPVTKVDDAPISLPQGPGLPMWSPKNFEGKFAGPTTLRRGLERSMDAMTVRLASQLGLDKITPLPIRFGVYDSLPPYLSNVLGAPETTLMRMTMGYAEFVNGGKKINATLIDRVQDRNGATIYRHDPRACDGCNVATWEDQSEPMLPDTRAQVLDPTTAFQIVSLLEGVVQRGTGVAVKAVGKPLAGKTGTSNDSKDVWFIGFSPDLTCGVFVGFDNPRTLGHREQGATVAAPIFRDFMKGALADEPATPFRVPPGIDFVSVDSHSGALVSPGAPGAILEAFKAGTEPGVAITDSTDQNQAVPTNTPGSTVSQGTGGLY